MPVPSRRRPLRTFRATFGRIARLIARAYALRDAVAKAPQGNAHWKLDPMLQELETMHQALLKKSPLLAAEVAGEVASPAKAIPPADKSRTPAAQAARLLAECQACGRHVCALLQQALAAGDSFCAQCGYAFLRALEKLLWVLRPLVDASRALSPSALPA